MPQACQPLRYSFVSPHTHTHTHTRMISPAGILCISGNPYGQEAAWELARALVRHTGGPMLALVRGCTYGVVCRALPWPLLPLCICDPCFASVSCGCTGSLFFDPRHPAAHSSCDAPRFAWCHPTPSHAPCLHHHHNSRPQSRSCTSGPLRGGTRRTRPVRLRSPARSRSRAACRASLTSTCGAARPALRP